MGVIRRRLAWLAVAALACELSALAGGPTISALGLTAAIDDCGCPNVAPGQMCPMHHHSRKGKEDGTCKMRSGCQPPEAALLSMAGGPGVLPAPTLLVSDFDLASPLKALTLSALARSGRPESPPPRA